MSERLCKLDLNSQYPYSVFSMLLWAWEQALLRVRYCLKYILGYITLVLHLLGKVQCQSLHGANFPGVWPKVLWTGNTKANQSGLKFSKSNPRKYTIPCVFIWMDCHAIQLRPLLNIFNNKLKFQSLFYWLYGVFILYDWIWFSHGHGMALLVTYK